MGGATYRGARGVFWSKGTALYLVCADSYVTIYVSKITELYPKRVNFIVYKLYLSLSKMRKDYLALSLRAFLKRNQKYI